MNLDSVFQKSPQQILKPFFEGMTDDMQSCIQDCITCSEACEQLIQPCLTKGGPHASPDHIRRLQDCVEVCTLTAKMMMRHSEVHPQMCDLCSQVCDICAKDCLAFNDDELMKSCGEICRRCADSCQKMMSMH